MNFRIAGRHDSLLLGGFTLALLVVFQRSLQELLNIASDIQQTYGVALIPALLILTIMFVFHLAANRREARAEAAAAALEAAHARARNRELERLMTLGQSLSRVLTIDAMHEAIWRHLPPLANGADIWMLVRRNTDWERVTDRAGARWKAGSIEAIAGDCLDATPEDFERPEGIERAGFICHVIVTGGRVAAIVGLAVQDAPAEVRRTIGAASTLLGIALRNVQLFAEVRDHGLRDALTGCFNRAHGLETLDVEIARSRRGETDLSVLMFDVDHFKRINDEHGHLVGDEVLGAVGRRLRQVLRRSDVRCRYGGDEFLIILPETPRAGAIRVAEWVRGEMQQIAVPVGESVLTPALSIGVATAVPGEPSDVLLERADRALYAAKAAGRDCIRTSTAPLRTTPPLAVVR